MNALVIYAAVAPIAATWVGVAIGRRSPSREALRRHDAAVLAEIDRYAEDRVARILNDRS
ncbi:hypothetical protein ABZU76_02925 [Amycolatopsis sp. NPDC005232]|uniref:hypothetical protein n=1 Tax=Amycolatopsis sp. NPDC005232 TaxID=3157027 RepID=UPI0033BC201B